VLGGIDTAGSLFQREGQPVRAITPTDLRAALMVALEINPFDSQNLAVGSLSSHFGTSDHTLGQRRLREDLLGYRNASVGTLPGMG
jgi:hypothetical protein